MRLFIGIEFSGSVCAEVIRFQEILARKFREGLKFTDPKNCHATLAFLGEVSEDSVELLLEALRALGPCEFDNSVTVDVFGRFPIKGKPRVIWAGVKFADERIAEFKKEIDEVLSPLDIEVEKREWHPHVTVARVKDSSVLHEIDKVIERTKPEKTEHTFTGIYLYQSELKSDGPQYSKIFKFPLSCATD